MAEEVKSHDNSKILQGSSASNDSDNLDVLDKSQCSNDPKEKAYLTKIMGKKKFKTLLRYRGSREGRGGTSQESEHEHVSPCGVNRLSR